MSSKDLLIISILTFLTVAIWTVYDIYHTSVTTTVTPLQQEVAAPLDPTFDESVFNLLRKKDR